MTIGEKIHFILYKPAVPGNIGASARAMKTMGFSNMRLIDPMPTSEENHLCDEAKMLGHGSWDILENAKVFSTFDEASADIDFLICTTAKSRSAKVDYLDIRELNSFLKEKLPLTKKIGIVFGTEESGLPNSIIQACNLATSVPMHTTHPSLNLSQAVMVLAYEMAGLRAESLPEAEEQEEVTWKILQERSTTILQQAGIKPGTPLFHRIIERMSMMKASDARLVHSITSKLLE